jgi:hypothetical protein
MLDQSSVKMLTDMERALSEASDMGLKETLIDEVKFLHNLNSNSY